MGSAFFLYDRRDMRTAVKVRAELVGSGWFGRAPSAPLSVYNATRIRDFAGQHRERRCCLISFYAEGAPQ